MRDFPYDELHEIIEDIIGSNQKLIDMYYGLADLLTDGTVEHRYVFSMWLNYLEYAVIGLDKITEFLRECSECVYYKGISNDEINEMIQRYKRIMGKLADESDMEISFDEELS